MLKFSNSAVRFKEGFKLISAEWQQDSEERQITVSGIYTLRKIIIIIISIIINNIISA